MTADRLPPIHPGEVLREEFLSPLDMTPYALAAAINVPAPRIYAVVKEARAVSPSTALRLARYFGTTAAFWLNLQAAYDLETTQASEGADIEAIKPLARDRTQAA